MNLGVRYDYVSGMPLDQDRNPNFQVMQAAGAAGPFRGHGARRVRQVAEGRHGTTSSRESDLCTTCAATRAMWCARAGASTPTSRTRTRTRSMPRSMRQAASASCFLANNPAGIRKPDGSFFRASDPLSTIASQNLVNTSLPPLGGQVQSPRLEQPYTRQANVGWVHQLDSSTALSVDAVRADGRNVNTRLRINQLVNGRRYLADLRHPAEFEPVPRGAQQGHEPVQGARLRLEPSHVESPRRQRLVHARRMRGASSAAPPTKPTRTSCRMSANPFGAVQDAPLTRSDARHRVASAESSKHHSASTWRRSSSISRHSPRTPSKDST